MRKHRKKRGVSTIISSLMMIAIAIGLGITLYTAFSLQFSAGLSNISFLYNYKEKVLNTRFKVTWAYYNQDNHTLDIYIYNYGDIEAKIVSIYADGKKVGLETPVKILIGEIKEISIQLSDGLSQGNHYIKIVSDIGVGYGFQLWV